MSDLQTLSLRDMQALIGAWGDETFPDATPSTVFAHLQDEVTELERSLLFRATMLGRPQTQIPDELADVSILTMQLAHRLGIDLATAVEEKHARNLTRTWVKDEEAGYWRHAAPTCRVCGCTDEYGCDVGCYWIEPDLCSSCAVIREEAMP